MQKILVVDDEAGIRDLVSESLELSGFEVETAKNGREALGLAETKDYDMLVLDVMMPALGGFEVVETLREEGNLVPILLLTAKDSVTNKLKGFEVGGDDYLVKPFSLEELVARIQAILKRSGGEMQAGGQDFTPNEIVVQDLRLNLDAHEVYRNGELIELSPTEYALLKLLAENAGRVIERDKIMDIIWGGGWREDYSLLEAYISYLRKKIDSDEDLPKLIHTKRSIGYMVK